MSTRPTHTHTVPVTGVKYILLGEGCPQGALRRALAREGEVSLFDCRIHFAHVLAVAGFDLVMCGAASNVPVAGSRAGDGR